MQKLKFTAISEDKSPSGLGGDETGPTFAITKIGQIIQLLRRPEGARLDELMTATGWQAHSIRGALSGTIKRKLNFAVTSEKVGSVRTYRILEENRS